MSFKSSLLSCVRFVRLTSSGGGVILGEFEPTGKVLFVFMEKVFSRLAYKRSALDLFSDLLRHK